MKDLSKMLEVKCDCSETVDWHELKEFQGGLKSRDDSDYEKMKTSLLKYGWSFVMYYWNDGKTKWILDGHNRKHVLQNLEKEGYFIPPLPAIEVYAKDKKEAKQKLLRLNSQYGKMTKESVLEFAEDIDLNFDEIALPDTTISFEDDTEAVEDFPELKEGDRDTQCTMTFVLSQEQVEIIKEALKKCGPIQDGTNTNGNGNKLAEICKEYLLNG
jgi:hypothetical protein